MSFNFALILFWLLAATGAVSLADLLYFRPRRRRDAEEAGSAYDATVAGRIGVTQAVLVEDRQRLIESRLRQPWWIEFPVGFFPVILIVFLLRSFLFEPFRIPSGSMIPTLLVGDLILVNKFDYGIRLPLLNKKVIAIGDPQRGDVMVFRYPIDPSIDYIKRVVGLPGDRVTYRDKHIEINGQPVEENPMSDYFDADKVMYSRQFKESLPSTGRTVEHRILNDDSRSQQIPQGSYAFSDNCTHSNNDTVISCVVPPAHYFMMGDNRDNSEDSRYWGFVPDENIVGKAFFIWMNFGNIGRIGGIQ
jgi:signal peptidase I